MVAHGELGNGNQNPDKQKQGADQSLPAYSLMKYKRLQEGKEQWEGGKGNCPDCHSRYLYGLEEGSPVNRHNCAGCDDEAYIPA